MKKTLVLSLQGLPSSFARKAVFKLVDQELRAMGFGWQAEPNQTWDVKFLYVNHSDSSERVLLLDTSSTITPSNFDTVIFHASSEKDVEIFLARAKESLVPDSVKTIMQGVEVLISKNEVVLDPSKLLAQVEAEAHRYRAEVFK